MPPRFFRENVINISLVFDKKSKEHIPLLCPIAYSFRLPTLWCHWLTRLSVIRLMKSKEVWFQRRSTSTGPFLERNAFAHLYDYTVIPLRAFCCEHRDDSGQRWLIFLVLVRHKKSDCWSSRPVCTVKKQSEFKSGPRLKIGGPILFSVAQQ